MRAVQRRRRISIHALRAERDSADFLMPKVSSLFQSTRSERSATAVQSLLVSPIEISIHALRAERDAGTPQRAKRARGISIHALRAERDPLPLPLLVCDVLFQSTRSERSATAFSLNQVAIIPISIHALRAERDGRPVIPTALADLISIHALRAERDVNFISDDDIGVEDFNPRAPSGARPDTLYAQMVGRGLFQSTRSERSATLFLLPCVTVQSHFNPRAPSGARPPRGRVMAPRRDFNPRAPSGARLIGDFCGESGNAYFNPRAPSGARLVLWSVGRH